jgi:hypothetical protein
MKKSLIYLTLVCMTLASCEKAVESPAPTPQVIAPKASSSISFDKLSVPCTLTVTGSNPKETTSIKVFAENESIVGSSTAQSLNQIISNSGLYTIEYTVSNSAGTSTKMDTVIVFENSAVQDFYEVKLKDLPVRIRKANAEKLSNQSTFLFLYNKINRMKSQLPDLAFNQFTKITLWMDDNSMPNYTAVYHPSATWLTQNGYMKEKAKGVEISNFANFMSYSKEQADIILHEFTHAYHDQFMVNGFNNKLILDAYKASMATKKYESVDYIGGGKKKHYATENQQEYFSEITEAYFGKNDFYPFIRSELKSFDAQAFELVEKVWISGLKQ